MCGGGGYMQQQLRNIVYCEVMVITWRRTGSLPSWLLCSYFIVRSIMIVKRMTPGEKMLTNIFFVARRGYWTVSFVNVKIGSLRK
jgi:hypothetical protein